MKLAAVVVAIVAVGVYANFTTFKYPNDGVYYVAAARELLDSGRHVDATIVPAGPPITRQNGIVYVLAALMALAGTAWPVAYVLLVAALWTAAIRAMAAFFAALLDGSPTRLSGYRLSGLLAGLTVLQYDLLNDSTSFMNEGIYLPASFLIAAVAGAALAGIRTRAAARDALARLPRWFAPAALLFVAAGMFFRNQHVVLLPLAVAVCVLMRRPLTGIALAAVAIGSFAVYARWLPAPVTDAYLATTLSLGSLEASDGAYALAMFTGPLSLPKALPYGHPIVLCCGGAMAAAVLIGLRRMHRGHPLLAAGLGAYIAGTLVFLVLLPFVSTRYYALVNLPLVAALVPLMNQRRRAFAWTAAAAAAIAAVLASYVLSYVSGTKPEQALPQLQAHADAAGLAEGPLFYSSQPRMVYWTTGRGACAAPPDACAPRLGTGPRRVLFIGRSDELEGQHALAGYTIDRPVTTPRNGYAAWAITAR